MEKVKYVSGNGVSIITFNRPDKYNALDVDTLNSLLEIINKVEKNDDRIVIMTGEGKSFSAGGDVGMMAKFRDQDSFNEMMNIIENITLKLYMLPKLVIAAVRGSAVGLGMSIALNSDYVIAHKSAKFGMLFAGIGLIPDGGGHFLLKERLGTHQAKQFIWSLRQVEGEEAKKMGFVDEVTEQDVLEEAFQLVSRLQHSPLLAIIESKMILHGRQKEELQQFLFQEKHGQLKMGETEDHSEGVRAFLEKRMPNFRGV